MVKISVLETLLLTIAIGSTTIQAEGQHFHLHRRDVRARAAEHAIYKNSSTIYNSTIPTSPASLGLSSTTTNIETSSAIDISTTSTQSSSTASTSTQLSTAIPTAFPGFYNAWADIAGLPPNPYSNTTFEEYGPSSVQQCHESCDKSANCTMFVTWEQILLGSYGCALYSKTYPEPQFDITTINGFNVSRAIGWVRGIDPTVVPATFKTSSKCGLQALPKFSNFTYSGIDQIWSLAECKKSCLSQPDCQAYSWDVSFQYCSYYNQQDVFSNIEEQEYAGVWFFDRSCDVSKSLLSFKTTRLTDAQRAKVCGVPGDLVPEAGQWPNVVYEGSANDNIACGRRCDGHTYSVGPGGPQNCHCYASAIGKNMVPNNSSDLAFYDRDCWPWVFMYTGNAVA